MWSVRAIVRTVGERRHVLVKAALPPPEPQPRSRLPLFGVKTWPKASSFFLRVVLRIKSSHLCEVVIPVSDT